jgi:hypothetical protein
MLSRQQQDEFIHDNDKQKSYVIFLNSANGSGASNTVKTFRFDWSTIREQKYKLDFVYSGSAANNTTYLDVLYVNMNLGCNTNAYEAKSTVNNALLSTNIGCILPNSMSTSSYYYAFENSNPSLFLDTRPTNQNFTVSINTNVDTQYANFPAYILTLKLTPVK